MLKSTVSFRRAITALILSFAAISPSLSLAGGVSLGATRVIYPGMAKQTSLSITNSDQKTRYLIQSWIEDGQGKKSADFVLTPPLFVSKTKSENTLRIMYTGVALPQDRETVYWINSKAIPAVEKGDLDAKNVLQIAILSRIKLFMRPDNLLTKPDDAPRSLIFSRQGKTITINNPSPYYVTLVNVTVGNKSVAGVMVSPKENKIINVPDNTASEIKYQAITDYGSNTPVITAKIK